MGVKRQLLKAGVDPGLINDEWLEATIAAMSKWIQTTDEGVHHVGSLLRFQVEEGDQSKDYKLIDDDRGLILDVRSSDVLFFRGLLVERRPIPLSHLEIYDKERESCDSCGTISHCTQLVTDPGYQRPETLCNFCVVHHEHPRVYDQGNAARCLTCPLTSCSHNPGKKSAIG